MVPVKLAEANAPSNPLDEFLCIIILPICVGVSSSVMESGVKCNGILVVFLFELTIASVELDIGEPMACALDTQLSFA